MMNIISLGAGVQSSTLALMAAHGEITPMPDCAIFADTQAERKAVYEWLDWLEKQLPFPIYRVTKGPLKDDVKLIPSFGPTGPGRIFCSSHYKRDVVRRQARVVAGKQPVSMWIGISRDEASRMKDSGKLWLTHRFPLIEQRLSRQDCQAWLVREAGRTAPRSSCVFCPMRTDAEWRLVKANVDDWSLALSVDEKLRIDGYFLHSSCVPLDQADFSTDEDRGQLNMFENECEGMCGV